MPFAGQLLPTRPFGRVNTSLTSYGDITASTSNITVVDARATDDLEVLGAGRINESLAVYGDITATTSDITANDWTYDGDEKYSTYYQPRLQYSAAFDIEEATMDADDGTGINVGSVELNFDGQLTRCWIDVTQGNACATDTLELWINNADDAASVVTTLVSAQACDAASLLFYAPSSSTSVPIAKVSTTNKWIVAVYKDVGNAGGSGANLQFKIFTEYIKQ